MKQKGIRGFIRNVWIWITCLFGGSMKIAGDEMFGQRGGAGSKGEVNKKLSVEGVMRDFINGEETERVKEFRDAYYRILNEADKYKVKLNVKINNDGEIDALSATAEKKEMAYFDKKIDVYNPELKPIRVIQDNFKFAKNSSFDGEAVFKEFIEGGVLNYDTTLTIKRDGFRPRFEIEKFANKVVVLGDGNNGEYNIHIYTTMYASQFGKIDAIYIAELTRMRTQENYKTDITSMESLSFVTDKSYHCDNRCEFEFVDIRYNGIEVYDGNFVIMFTGKAIKDGISLMSKYHTDAMDKKYGKMENKKNVIDVFTIDRNENKRKEAENNYNEKEK